MTLSGWLQIIIFLTVLVLLVKPLGHYMTCVFEGKKTLLDPIIKPVEKWIYRSGGINETHEMDWKEYTVQVLALGLIGFIFLYAILRQQAVLPFNPMHYPAVPPDLALNAAVSFVTNTNWQSYAGEASMSFFSQLIGFTVQNFISAGTGVAVLLALVRALARKSTHLIGNFWVDLSRSILYIFLPLSIVLSLFLVSQGVVQTMTSSVASAGLEASGNQTILMGPVASQVSIKQLGTNGGGFFNANSAHPFENPTPLSNFVEMLAIVLIPAALTYTYGEMVGDKRQGWAILATMAIILILFIGVAYKAESQVNPLLPSTLIDQTATGTNPGGNMEGKEVRFGVENSALWSVLTTAASNGSVNAMHDSYSPLGGFALLVLMQLGEVIFGGVGSGLYGMLVFVIIAVFVAGLMVGRTPEYLGKKIETFEMKMAAILILIMPILVLGLTALAVSTPAGKTSVLNGGPHGFSEILYAFTSQGNNNGSAFAGLNANTPFYNILGAIAMLISRYWLIVPTLALAGSLAAKKKLPAGNGTLPTHNLLFIGWTVGIVLIVGALNFIPALALGPIAEAFTRLAH